MSDFSQYATEQFVDWLSQGTIASAPTTIYVTLFDDQGSELNGSVANGRVGVTAGSGWTDNGGDFENASEVDFGEATADITIQDVALYDSDTGGSNNELARYQIEDDSGNDTTQSVNTGTRVFFAAGDLSFDVIDQNE